MVLESSLPLIGVDRLSLTLGLRKTRAGRVLSPGTRLFDNLNWRLDAGCHATVDGPSGSGKTSFLRLLSGLIPPTSGRIEWQGQPYDAVPMAILRQQVVYVSQTPKLLGMTVADAIAYPLRLRGLPESQVQARAGDIIEQMEIPQSWLIQTELQLSQGSQQWVHLARALVIAPIVLLLDEPTAALDIPQRHCLMNALQSLPKTTYAIASHDSEWITALMSGNLAEAPSPNRLTLTSSRAHQAIRDAEDW